LREHVSDKDIEAWTKRLETEWTCAQFASGLQVTPKLASAILEKNAETLPSFAKARMILSTALVKRRVVTDLGPLEALLSDLGAESDDWIKVLLACLDKGRIGGGPLELDMASVTSPSIQTSVDSLRTLAEAPPKCLEHGNNWESLYPLSEKAFRRHLPENLEKQTSGAKHFKLL